MAITNKLCAKRSAILVIHGIGNQNPLETIDQFSRTLVKSLEKSLGCQVELSHGLAKKKRSDGQDLWFDNYLRIHFKREGLILEEYLDVYEYYWAHYTEDQAELTDIAAWVSQVTSGAKKFYRENKELGESYGDKSAFFQNRKFQSSKYFFFIYFFGAFLPAISFFFSQFLKFMTYIPILGIPFRSLVSWYSGTKLKYLANVIGDIIIYNSMDEKCRFYRIRQEILSGGVKALRYLLEPDEYNQAKYDRVLVAGHSLGSQVSYDTINRLIHLVNADEMKGFEGDKRTNLSSLLTGFVTFGSPLDKIAFFLRERVSKNEYIRAQLLKNFHAFKQQDWLRNQGKNWPYQINPIFDRLLEDIKWKNYFDERDYVSGSLDYYQNLVNVDLKFNSRNTSFTHSWYWESSAMFDDIVASFLINHQGSQDH